MSDSSATTPEIHWWQSRTIWAGIVAVICGIAAITGRNIDPGTQVTLVNDLTNAASALGEVSSLLTVYYRAKAVAPIKPQIIPPALGGSPDTKPTA